MNRCVIFISLIFSVLISCSGTNPASAPTSPAQIPTAIEYAGGDVSGDISVQTDTTATFIAKDVDGNIIEDPSVIDVVLKLPDGTVVSSLNKATLAETSSYGTVTTDGSNIIYTAPNADFSDTNRLTLEFSYSDASANMSKATQQVLDTYTTLTSPSKDAVESGNYAPTELLRIEDIENPRPDIVSDKQNNLYLCYGGYFYQKSENDGIDWSDAIALSDDELSNTFATNCTIETYADYVAVAWSLNSTSSKIAVSTNGGDTFGIPTSLNGYFFDMKFDTNGALHVLKSALGEGSCAYNMEYFTYNIDDLDNPSVGPIMVNGEDCSVTIDSTPQLAVVGAGSAVYVVWTDDRDSSDARPLYDAYFATLENEAFTETKISSTVSDDEVLWAIDLNISIDRNNAAVVSWNMFTADILGYIGEAPMIGGYYLATYLEILNANASFDEYLVDSDTDFSVDPTWWYGRTSAVADYANNYHIFYRQADALKHRMGIIADNEFTTTETIDVVAGDTNLTNVATDYQGRNFVVTEVGTDEIIRTIVIQRMALTAD